MENKDPKTGKFTKGNKASPGRKPRHTEMTYLEAMYGVADPAEWAKATKKMVDLAKGGDVQAYRAIAPYYAGLPVQKLQLSNGETAQLAQLIDLLKTRGLSASAAFDAMIGLLAESAPVVLLDTNEDSEDE
jgi:hypothetical protein